MLSRFIALVVAAGLIATGATAATPKKKPRGHLGSEWVAPDGNMRRPQLGLMMIPPNADPEIYRSVEFDWEKSSIQTGPYPPNALKAEKEGEVSLRLAVDAAGKLTGCTIAQSSGSAELDAHACPHLIKYTSFHPALAKDGKRISYVSEARLSYELKLYMNVPVSNNVFEASPYQQAKASTPVTLDSLSITKADRAMTKNYGVGAWVTISPEGQPERCWLSSPTFVDSIDAKVCDGLMNDTSYVPARAQNGQAVRDRLSVFLTFR
jgi:TonB family protein